MPRVLFYENIDRRRAAAVQYFTGSKVGTEQEDIHLLYSLGREHGPGIIRDGIGPPRMALIDRPWETTTDSLVQRAGTWFINKKIKKNFIEKSEHKKFEDTNDYFSYFFPNFYDKDTIEDTIIQDSPLLDRLPLVGLQSFGDLTMNLWNVAFVKLPNSSNSSQPPKLIYLGDEPIDNRIYTCLVKWRPETDKIKVSIESLRFSRFTYDDNPTDPKVVMLAETGEAIADRIEFAVYGQLLIRNGTIVKPQEIVHQFSDIRHLLALPNLNPKGPLYTPNGNPLDTEWERVDTKQERKPRYYFGYEQKDDVWFGEAQLLSDRNLRRAALTGAIELNRLQAGASEEQIKAALQSRTVEVGGQFEPQPFYKEGLIPPNPLEPSQWRFVMEDHSLVEVYLRPNIYPCSILGVTERGDVVCFACRGNYTVPPGYTILQDTTIDGKSVSSAAAKLLSESVGIKDAILLDEGNDVRHECFDPEVDKWRELVVDKGNREQVRAIFLFTGKKK